MFSFELGGWRWFGGPGINYIRCEMCGNILYDFITATIILCTSLAFARFTTEIRMVTLVL